MKSFQSNKKVLITSILLLLTVILFYSLANAVDGDSFAKLFGKQQADILVNAGDGIVAIIDGEKISKKGFDTYKFIISSGDNKLSDSQILDKILEQKVIYDIALKEGIVATDEEVENYIKTIQSTIKEKNEQYAAFIDYITGLNMTEDQYWQSVKPAYKKFITRSKFKNTLKEKYAKDNKIDDKTELNKKFSDYYNQYIKDLKSKVKVETYF